MQFPPINSYSFSIRGAGTSGSRSAVACAVGVGVEVAAQSSTSCSTAAGIRSHHVSSSSCAVRWTTAPPMHAPSTRQPTMTMDITADARELALSAAAGPWWKRRWSSPTTRRLVQASTKSTSGGALKKGRRQGLSAHVSSPATFSINSVGNSGLYGSVGEPFLRPNAPFAQPY